MSKTILITGASSGDLIRMPNVLVTRLDVRDEASIATSIAETKDRFGRIDAVLSNAGFGQYGVFEAISNEQVRHQAFYDSVTAAVNEKLASHSLASADEVAQAIYEAATDNSDRLRYVVGKDAAAIISARRMTSEREFMDLIRAGFGLANVARA
jgi:hypothetical protein